MNLQVLDKDRSVVSSPLSVEFVLGLLTLGADEPAHSELLTALGIPNDDAVGIDNTYYLNLY